MNILTTSKNFNYILKVLFDNKQIELFRYVMLTIAKSNPDDIDYYERIVNDKKWMIYEGKTFKMFLNDIHDYHEFYSKITGFTIRFGKTINDNPEWCELGNTIANIECVSEKCQNTNNVNVFNCMSLYEADKLINFINQNNQLEQITWEITGFYTNSNFEKILSFTHEKGIISNYITNGVDIDNHAIDVTLKYCGRVSLSCCKRSKDICYNTLKNFGNAAKKANKNFTCNINLILSEDNIDHIMDVLNDAKEKKIENLGAFILLRPKNMGCEKNLNRSVSNETYEKLIRFCLDNDIKFGFENCCKIVKEILKKLNREDLISNVELYESSRFSGYFNVNSKYYNCSFCEQSDDNYELDPYIFNTYSDFWNSKEMNRFRFSENEYNCKSCLLSKIN